MGTKTNKKVCSRSGADIKLWVNHTQDNVSLQEGNTSILALHLFPIPACLPGSEAGILIASKDSSAWGVAAFRQAAALFLYLPPLPSEADPVSGSRP